MSDPPAADRFNRFPGLLGMRVAEIRPGYCRMEMNVEEKHLRFRANGLHAGAVVSLADSACGAGCQASLEPGKTFSTVELKANLISSASSGRPSVATWSRRRSAPAAAWAALAATSATAACRTRRTG